MGKTGFTSLIFLVCTTAFSQLLDLPPDFRPHNLREYNSNLFNPAFSLRQSTEHQVALWSRWQWQNIDADPTTLNVSYIRSQERMAYGAGYIQHSTGFFQQQGGMLNFAYQFSLGTELSIGLGLNLFGYQQSLLDDRFDPGDGFLPIDDEVNDFIFQMAPGLEVRLQGLGLGVVFDNMVDYNFTENETVTQSDEKILTFMGRYQFLVLEGRSGRDTYLEPMLYYRRVPGFDNQIGLSALWSAHSYWAQAGYNSYYGISVGAGGRLFQKFSLGALIEFGSNENTVGGDTSYELVMALSFGEKQIVEPEEELEEDLIVEEELKDGETAQLAEEVEAQQQAIEEAARQQELAMERRRDSIRESEEMALALQRRQDSIREAEQAAVALNEKVVPEKGEKYQEVSREEGLQPGFYLIANVFGTKKYYDKFMQQLADEGLEPKSFYRAANKFNYVYLQRYNTIEEARRARDSKFDGKYEGDLWVFRIR